MTLPIPVDLEAEERLLTAVLCANAQPSTFPALGPEDFYSQANRIMWRVFGSQQSREIESLSRAAHALGWRGSIGRYLVMLRDTRPTLSERDVAEAAARVLEMSQRRAICRIMRTLVTRLSCDELSMAEARASLLAIYGPLRKEERPQPLTE